MLRWVADITVISGALIANIGIVSALFRHFLRLWVNEVAPWTFTGALFVLVPIAPYPMLVF